MAAAKGTSLRQYALTRLALVIPMVFVLLTLVFLLMRVAPGDPISSALGGRVPKEEVERSRRLGFDRPIYVQYGDYLADIARGDFGTTITDRVRSATSSGERRRDTRTDVLRDDRRDRRRCHVRAPGGPVPGHVDRRWRPDLRDLIYAMPVFFLGLMAQLFFGSYLGWLPTSDRASPITDATLEMHTNIYTIDTLINRDWDAFVDVSKH